MKSAKVYYNQQHFRQTNVIDLTQTLTMIFKIQLPSDPLQNVPKLN